MPEVILENHKTYPSSLLVELTEREIEILKLLIQGLSNPEIATLLFISQSTVKTHLRSLYKKLNVEHRVQAAVIGVQQGLI
jgi:two-component system, NarL family, response regulator LiaR